LLHLHTEDINSHTKHLLSFVLYIDIYMTYQIEGVFIVRGLNYDAWINQYRGVYFFFITAM